MKLFLCTLTCVGLSAAAHAQSNVTIFGHMDLSLAYSKAGSVSRTTLEQGGHLVPSRLGFRGTEDLGGGLSAGFWIEAAVLPDTGAASSTFWGRRSTVSLLSKDWGEIRLGRDYTPTFWNISQFTPFGTVGVAGSSNIVAGWPNGLGATRTLSRSSNSIGYFLPNLNGVYGQFMASAAEGVDGNSYRGGRIGYAKGPVNVAVGYGRTASNQSHHTVSTIGGIYDFSVVKVYANYVRQSLLNDKQENVSLGAVVPVGPGLIKASVAYSDQSGPTTGANDAKAYSIGYVHFLSKRTALYSAVSRITNNGRAAYVTTDGSPAGVPGQPSSGVQFGVSHSF